ncbi:hypothetical protein SUDANB25_02502 [Streptomyces sp. SudanB25_2051]
MPGGPAGEPVPPGRAVQPVSRSPVVTGGIPDHGRLP